MLTCKILSIRQFREAHLVMIAKSRKILRETKTILKQDKPYIAGPKRKGMPFLTRFDLRDLKAVDKQIKAV